MILTGSEIKKAVLSGKIFISPFEEANINPNSYNYRIGNELLVAEDKTIDTKKPVRYRKVVLNQNGYLLRPNKLYLASTLEELGSDYYVISLIGRSSVGRLGLFLQITADLGHIGTKHCWTLELTVIQPLIIYPLMKIGQVSFWQSRGSKKNKYSGIYTKYSKPHISEMFNEL